jgi:hypothetical protein
MQRALSQAVDKDAEVPVLCLNSPGDMLRSSCHSMEVEFLNQCQV